MNIEVLPNREAVFHRAAELIAIQARAAIAARGRFLIAMSGGKTPARMLRLLTECDIEWQRVHIFQVDERIAPGGDKSRNLTHLLENLVAPIGFPRNQLYAMPVKNDDLRAAAECYEASLLRVAGSPVVLDLIHLGLGYDGHTASLVAGDPVLSIIDRDVAVTSSYQGYRRMTLTCPVINRARSILWVVVGADKHDALVKLRNGDQSIPAGCVQAASATVLTDHSAAGPAIKSSTYADGSGDPSA